VQIQNKDTNVNTNNPTPTPTPATVTQKQVDSNPTINQQLNHSPKLELESIQTNTIDNKENKTTDNKISSDKIKQQSYPI